MRLLTGPPGSGKTAIVLERFRAALREGNTSVRLLVPTATMAQHLENCIAREGFVFRRGLIQTLSRFLDGFGDAAPQVPDTVLYLIVEQAVRRVARPEFAGVAQLPGFSASLAATIGEFSSTGCDSARLSGCLPDTPLGAAFIAVHREVDRELARRGMAMRAKRLERLAARIESEGLGGIETVWLDGFHALPDPELRVVRAMAACSDLTLTLADVPDPGEAAGDGADLRSRLLASGFTEERAPGPGTAPALALVKAPNVEREADEIARRILKLAAGGRAFREMGIVVRAADTYVPVLRSTLERFGIPARFYFDAPLERHAVVRFLTGVVDAMLGDWEHEQTLAAVRLAPRFADSIAMDRFAFAVLGQIPNHGLAALKALLLGDDGRPSSNDAGQLIHLLDSLAALEEWRSFSLFARDWAARFRTLRALWRPARPGPDANRQMALDWRSQATALDLLDEALDEAACALGGDHPLEIDGYWRAVKSILRLKPLRLEDRRRNVVHVLSVHEARQWILPVVFVCGMVENQFPQFHPQNPFFPNEARLRLNAAGIRVRASAEFDAEERLLFESAVSRATDSVTLSYPEFDARGERNLPSVFLKTRPLAPQDAHAAQPRPRNTPSPPPPPAIRATGLLETLRARTARLSPTRLETFLKCRFRFFGEHTLRLVKPPARPEDRFDFLAQGTLVHDVLRRWVEEPQPVDALFEPAFERACEELRVPPGYRAERLRHAMLEDLRGFTENERWPHDRFRALLEEKFTFALDDSLQIAGKIDRLEIAPGGKAWVIDYKYSGPGNVKKKLEDESVLQPQLYLIAAQKNYGLEPAGMLYAAVKGDVTYAGWGEGPAPVKVAAKDYGPFPEQWLELAAARALAAAAEMRAGRIEPAGDDVESCGYCDFRDVCRVAAHAAVADVEGA